MAALMKEFNWGLAYSFRGLVQYHHGREHDIIQAGALAIVESDILIPRQRERENLGLERCSQTSKPTPSDIPSPTRPHLLIVVILSKRSTP